MVGEVVVLWSDLVRRGELRPARLVKEECLRFCVGLYSVSSSEY